METRLDRKTMPHKSKKVESINTGTCRASALLKACKKGWLAVLFSCIAFGFGLPSISTADEADVVDVKIFKTGRDKFRIDATVKHADTGWDHYSNKFEVLDTEGNLLGTRVLHHPHVNEQPFTRSVTLEIPKSVTSVVVRAGDSVHELGGAEITIAVPHDG